MSIINNEIKESNTFFYNKDYSLHKQPALNLIPSEEITYKLDNVLPLTSKFSVIVYNNLIKIKSGYCNPSNPGNCKNIERKIKTFSLNSRRNLSKHLCRIRFDQYRERFFATLTFHDNYPNKRIVMKNLIDVYQKRLKRLFPELAFVWKLEFQKRGAPHLHYLLLFPQRLSYKDRSNLASSIRDNWNELVSKKYKTYECLQVDIRQVGNNEKTASYIMKYVEKLDEEINDLSLGRFWALSANLNENPLLVINCDEKFFENFRLILLHYIRDTYKLSEDDYRRIAMNNSFEVCLYKDSALSMLKNLSNKLKLTYIDAQIKNSPP